MDGVVELECLVAELLAELEALGDREGCGELRFLALLFLVDLRPLGLVAWGKKRLVRARSLGLDGTSELLLLRMAVLTWLVSARVGRNGEVSSASSLQVARVKGAWSGEWLWNAGCHGKAANFFRSAVRSRIPSRPFLSED